MNNAACLQYVCANGPRYGYFQSPAKSWYICNEADKGIARVVFNGLRLTIKMISGRKCFGGFIGSAASNEEWMEEKLAI